MGQTHTFIIPKQSDSQIVEGIRAALEKCGMPWSQISFQYSFVNGNYLLSKEKGAIEPGAAVLAEKAQVCSSFTCSLEQVYEGYVIQVRRNAEEAHDIAQFIAPNSPARTEEPPDHAKIAKLHAALEKELKAFRLQEMLGKFLGKELQQHYEEREASLTRLEAISANLIENLAARQKEQSDALEADFQAKSTTKNAELETLRSQLESDATKRREALDAGEKALEKRLAEIDDRDSRHARREIRKDLQKAIQGRAEKFELTAGTRHMRWPMHALCSGLLASFGWAIWHTLQFGIVGADPWQVAVRQIFLGVGFSSTAVFYIRWMNDWFQRHAREEFKLKRLELDLDRASWVVEMALEWKEEKGTELPADLVQTLARNLFIENDAKAEPLHPADQVASALFGASSEATIALPGGSSVKLDRKGIGQLKEG